MYFSRKIAEARDDFGKPACGRRAPGRVEGDGAKRVAEDVAQEGDLRLPGEQHAERVPEGERRGAPAAWH
jgi:hypothetical protein